MFTEQAQQFPAAYAHLAVDVQYMFCSRLWNNPAAYAASVRDTADQLWQNHNIPTVVIASTQYWGRLDEFILCKSELIDPSSENRAKRQELVKEFGLQDMGLRPHDILLIKNRSDAFEAPLLVEHLYGMSVNHTLVSGLDSDRCVAATVTGAVAAGFHCTVLSDRLARTATRDNTAAYHIGLVESNLGEGTDKSMVAYAESRLFSPTSSPAPYAPGIVLPIRAAVLAA